MPLKSIYMPYAQSTCCALMGECPNVYVTYKLTGNDHVMYQ